MLERLFAQAGRTAKSGGSTTGSPRVSDQFGDLDLLPVDHEHDGACDHISVLVALSGTPVDQDAMKLACNAAKSKRSYTNMRVELSAVYGISVPRTLAVDAEMPQPVMDEAQKTLTSAEEVATSMHCEVQAEYIQARNIGQSVVQLAGNTSCALIIVGVPYQVDSEGQFVLSDVADYVLKNAHCRVWLVRGNPVQAEPQAEPVKEAAIAR